jgi:DNA polymerase III delta prime subunit
MITTRPFIYKYKPERFKDFQIDNDIITILNTMISMNNLNILFVGDSGSGKTSLVNALMKEYYGDISYIDDILIINSLKEQGIHYYRTDVKTFCQTRCSIPNKKKIVVLDDIDNINEQSQQVFRNCIDKYSNNVHFISSCSNVQKVIDSLQSRQIIIKMKPLSSIYLNNILQDVKNRENISMDEMAEKFVLELASGSVRILLNYLEKFKILNEHVTQELVNQVCTNISFSIFDEYTSFILKSDLSEGVSILYELFDRGYSVMDIYDNYFLYVKLTPLLNETQKYETIKLLCKYITVFHNIHEDEIELALFTNNLSTLFSS